MCVSSLGGAVAVLPIVADRGRARRCRARPSTPAASRALAFAAVAAAGLGSLAWAAVLSRVRAAVAALGLYLVPLGGAIASHVGLDEPLYARHAVGALIVIAAILLGALRSQPISRPGRAAS